MNILEDKLPGGGGGGRTGGSWFHASVKTISRGGTGRSAVAAAAYRLGAKLEDAKGTVHDYERRSGVVTTFMMAPPDAPEWAFDAGQFWNRAEAAEKRKDARVARELELALPDSLTPDERKALVARMAQHLVEQYGVGITVAIHAPGKHGDDRNHHAHLLFSTRRLGPEGFGAKTRELDDKVQGAAEITALRRKSAELINAALEAAGHDERVDWRSFQSRGIAREGTRHLGPSAHQLEKKGKGSRRGERNREITEGNGKLDQLVEELAALEAELSQVQEALLDERYGPLDAPPPDAGPQDPAPGTAEPLPGDRPAWWPQAREPQQTLAPEQVDPLMNEAVAPYLAQLAQYGELQDGEPERWHERIARRGYELLRGAATWAHGKWQSLVANRRGREEHRRSGPDLER